MKAKQSELSRGGGVAVGLASTTVTALVCGVLQPEDVRVLIVLIIGVFLTTGLLVMRVPALRTTDGVTAGVPLLITSLCTGVGAGLAGDMLRTPLFGHLQDAVSVEAFDSSAVAWRFTDATVLIDRRSQADIRGRYGVVDHAHVAPVARADSRAPVTLFAVALDTDLSEAKTQWAKPVLAVRVRGFQIDDFRQAAAASRVEHVNEPIFVRFADAWDPIASLVTLGQVLAGCALVLVVSSRFGSRRAGTR